MSIDRTPAHLQAVRKDRRIIVNLDTGWGMPGVEDLDADAFIEANIRYLAGKTNSQVDSIWWCWGDMNYGPYRSHLLPEKEPYQKWLKNGVDPLKKCIEQCRARGLEVFYSFRINESSPGGEGCVEPEPWPVWPFLKENPHCGIPSPYWPAPFRHFNFAIEAVRQYKLAIIREIADHYAFDGIEIDWRCGYGSCLPFMHDWEYRDHLTDFMRSVRHLLLDVEKRRDKPFLLAARVPESLIGCHYDGIDIERWTQEQLVDILALGCHNFEVDIEAFKRLCSGNEIKLYPSIDDHHCSSGYEQATPDLWRGVCTNFLNQGADGIYAFNFYPVPALLDTRWTEQREKVRQQALCEIGSLDSMKGTDKLFVTQRRGGGGWPETAEHFYANTNCLAQLPHVLSDVLVYGGHQINSIHETYVRITVYEDVSTPENQDIDIQLRLLISDNTAERRPWEERIHHEPIEICRLSSHNYAHPPAKAILRQLRTRLNGIILDSPRAEQGWIVYSLKPVYLAKGQNVVALQLKNGEREAKMVTIEKLEVLISHQQ